MFWMAVAYAEDEGENAGAHGGGDEFVTDILDTCVSVGVVDVRARRFPREGVCARAT